jgi:hypothetical protein
VLVSLSLLSIARAQEQREASPQVLSVGLAHGSEAEAAMAAELHALLRSHDIEPWMLTRRVLVDETELPHSHPVLTIHTRHIGDPLGLLATFVHEQLHWLEADPWLENFRAAMAELGELFPQVPAPSEGGGRDDESTYRHLLVCDLEYQALTALVGAAAARATLERFTHYEWIYDQVLDDARIRDVALRHGFDVSSGVPRPQP